MSLKPEDAVSTVHEVIRSDLLPHEFPTEGEWKRALVDRKVLEQAFLAHEPTSPTSDTVSITHKLRSERFVAVPKGAKAISFIFDIVRGSTN